MSGLRLESCDGLEDSSLLDDQVELLADEVGLGWEASRFFRIRCDFESGQGCVQWRRGELKNLCWLHQVQ